MNGSFASFLLICTLFGIAGGLQGRSKGSSFVLWFLISACLPLFGFLASVVYPGQRHEQRRQCDGCGRLLPITDTMCMGCGTDLAFPEVRYMPQARGPRPVPAEGLDAGDGPAVPGGPAADPDGDDENPYEQAALRPAGVLGAPAAVAAAPTPAGASAAADAPAPAGAPATRE